MTLGEVVCDVYRNGEDDAYVRTVSAVGPHRVYRTYRLLRMRTGRWWAYETLPDGETGRTLDHDDTLRLIQASMASPATGRHAWHTDGHGVGRWLPHGWPRFAYGNGQKRQPGTFTLTDGVSVLTGRAHNGGLWVDGFPVPDNRYQWVLDQLRWLPAYSRFTVEAGRLRRTVVQPTALG